MSGRVSRAGRAVRPLRVPTPAEYAALGKRVFRLVTAPQAEVRVGMGAWTETEFARGDGYMTTDRLNRRLTLTVDFGGRRGRAETNQWDDAGLRRLVADAEAAARAVPGSGVPWELLGPQEYPAPPQVVFGATLGVTGATRAAVLEAALDATEAAGLIGAGQVHAGRSASAVLNTAGLTAYIDGGTYAEFSLTARTQDGTGSGWAWSGHEDWSRVEPQAVIARAVELAQRSANPQAVEPGRYTVILEPAAVAALLDFNWSAELADGGGTPFSAESKGTNKIGRRLLDPRLGIVSDPWDPAMPRGCVDGLDGTPLRKVVWVEGGVLRNLEYSRDYARVQGRAPVLNPGPMRVTVEGPTQTLDEMIASTRRGLWINRLGVGGWMDGRTMLLTGITRDGTFLIENGKITKPVKNLRFTESPLFVLNKLEACGEPVRATPNIVCPRLQVRDFHFTSMSEAI